MKLNKINVIAMVFLLFLVGCSTTNTNDSQSTFSSSAFNGGTKGLSFQFEKGSPPDKIQDNGLRPFNIRLRVINEGEYTIPANKAVIRLGNIDLHEFNISSLEDTIKVLPELRGYKKQGSEVIKPIPQYVFINNLKFVSNIVSGSQERNIYAYGCYPYETTALALLCINPNPITSLDSEMSNCEVNGEKEVSNSGAPVVIENVKESPSGQHSVRLEFDIVNKGTDDLKIFQSNSLDDHCRINGYEVTNVETFNYKDKITYFVGNMTNLDINCESTGTNSNTVQLIDNRYTVNCEINTENEVERETPIDIKLKYDVVDRISKKIIIEHIDR